MIRCYRDEAKKAAVFSQPDNLVSLSCGTKSKWDGADFPNAGEQ